MILLLRKSMMISKTLYHDILSSMGLPFCMQNKKVSLKEENFDV